MQIFYSERQMQFQKPNPFDELAYSALEQFRNEKTGCRPCDIWNSLIRGSQFDDLKFSERL